MHLNIDFSDAAQLFEYTQIYIIGLVTLLSSYFCFAFKKKGRKRGKGKQKDEEETKMSAHKSFIFLFVSVHCFDFFPFLLQFSLLWLLVLLLSYAAKSYTKRYL